MASKTEGETSGLQQPLPAAVGPSTMAASLPRENMIETAVKFLQNPKVRQSPFAQRRSFLEKKGLTDEEIQIAIDRSGTASDETNPPAVPAVVPAVTQQAPSSAMVPARPMAMAPMLPPPPPKSAWERWRDYIAVAVIVSGVTYGIVKFFKAYISPLMQSRKEEKERMERIEVAINELNGNINSTLGELKTTMARLQETLAEQTDRIQQVSTSSKWPTPSTSTDQQSVNEIKAELVSLKGLILSRHQFAAAPSPSPIPAWQRAVNNSQTNPPTLTDSTQTNPPTLTDSTQTSPPTLTDTTQTNPPTLTDSTQQPPLLQDNEASQPEPTANEDKPKTLTNGDTINTDNNDHLATALQGQSSLDVKGQDNIDQEADRSADVQTEQQPKVNGNSEKFNDLGSINANEVKGLMKVQSSNTDVTNNDEEVD